MRKIIFLLIALLLITPVLASAATVSLTPTSPGDNDALTCDVLGTTSKYIYKWYINGGWHSTSPELQTSIMAASYTTPGQQWKCKAYTPGSLFFPSSFVGEASVTIAGTSSTTTTIPPNPTNHDPTLQLVGNINYCASQSKPISLQGFDQDNDDLTYSVSPMPSGGTICDWNGIFEWKPSCNQLGTYQTTFKVTDEHGAYDSETVILTVTDCGACGFKPDMDPIPEQTVCAGDTVTITPHVTYLGQDTLRYSVSRLPPGGTWNAATHTLTWRTTLDDVNKPQQMTFIVEDERCNRDYSPTTIYIKDCSPPVNHCPTFYSVGDKTVCEGAVLPFTVSAYDQDNDPVTITASGVPSGASFNSGNFYWKPNDGQNGVYYVIFKATDGKCANPPTMSVKITVDNCIQPNTCPCLASIGPRTICEGEPLSITLSATDSDAGDVLTYSANNLPSGSSFSSGTKKFQWTPVNGQNGDYYVTFGVTDGDCPKSEQVHIRVNDCIADNHPPVLDPIGNRNVCMGSTLTIPLHGTDVDGDVLTYSASNTPSGSTLNPNTGVFIWTPNYCQGGSCNPTFCVSDGRLSDCETITITIINCNVPPVLSTIGSKTVCEGQALPFCISATDSNGDVLTYSASNLPSGAVFNSITKCFSWTPADGQNGNYAPTFTVSDGQYTDSETVSIKVDDCIRNHPPVLDPIGDRNVCMGSTLTIPLHGTDVDGDVLTYSGSNTPYGSTLNPNTGRFIWTPDACQGGTCHPTFCVSDGEYSDCETIAITVTNCNAPPVLSTIGPKTVCEGQQLPFCISATDPNGDALTYSVSGLPSGAVFNSITKCFSWTPADGQNGNYAPTFTVSDGQYSDSETVSITVDDCICNRPPVLDPIGNRNVCAGSTLTFPIYGTDPDGDALTYSASNLPSGAVFNPGTRTFTWTPQSCQGSTCNPTFCVSDGRLSDCETITITVTNCNQPPVLTTIGSKTVCEGEQLPFCISATDPNGDVLTYSASNLPVGAVFNSGTKCFSWTPVDGQNGNYAPTFTVSDGQYTDSETVSITVNDCICNQPPVLTTIGPKTVCEGQALPFCISATDPNGDALTYSASGLPSGAVFNSITKCFSWTPADGQNGNYAPTFTVSDGQYSDSETVSIAVNDCIQNHPPVLNPIGNKNVCIGSTLTFPIYGTDVDGDALTYSASNLPSGAVFNPNTRTFTWTPDACQGGICRPTFCVSDGELSDCETIAITVSNCNQPPVLQHIGDKTVCEGSQLQFCVIASDPDSADMLMYSAVGLPLGAVFNPSTKCFSWTPADGQNGNYHVTFSVTDNMYTTSETILITVSDCICNRPPVLDPIGNRNVCMGSSLTFTIRGTDPDGDALTYSASNIPSGSTFNAGTRTFSWTPDVCQGGTCHPTFCVSDGEFSDCETIAITVSNCNQPPVLQHIGDKTVCEGSQLQFCVIASDPDSADMLMYSAVGLPSGAVFNPSTKCFSWTPADGQNGNYPVTFSVTDNMYTTSETILITVSDCICNRPPVLDPIGNRNVCAGSTLNFAISGTDPDGDALTYSASNIPSGSTFNAGTRTFSWTPNICQGSTCHPTFCVSDGEFSDCETITITVSICNQGPSFAIPDQYMDEGETLTLNLNNFASDPNGDVLSFSRLSGVGTVSAATYTYYADFNSAGNHQASLRTNDGNGGVADATFTIHVTETEELEVETIQCFPVVIKGSEQSCSVTLTQKIGGATVTLKDFDTNVVLGTCTTDALTGACTDNFGVNTLGTFKVYATAVKTGYISDEDKTPTFIYRVIEKRYNIEELKVYNDPAYTVEDYDFFRAEDMYVRFQVKDMVSGLCATDVVTSATLVSPPGGRADLNVFQPVSACYNYFHLRIPPTHGFLGNSQVFTFAFNFNDNTGGEAIVDLTIRNNPPYIEPVIPNQAVIAGASITVNLAGYKHDIEDSGVDLRWQISGFDASKISVSVAGDILTIIGISPDTTGFVLKLLDLDNDFDTQAVWVNVGCQKLPPIANPNGPYPGTVGTLIQFSSLGSSDPDGGSLTYLWEFGDGGVSTEAHPVHTYAAEGTYTVRLTVTDDELETATAVTQAVIGAIDGPEDRLYRDDLFVKHLSVNNNNNVMATSKSIPVMVAIENRGDFDVKRLHLTIMIRELGLMLSDKNIKLENGDTFSQLFMFENPGVKGKFTLMLHLTTEEGLERTKFVEFEII